MPWSPADAEKHKKGLNDKQKKKWAKIANGILSECQDMKQKDCEAKAIRIANSSVGGN